MSSKAPASVEWNLLKSRLLFNNLSHRASNGSKIDSTHRLGLASTFNLLPRVHKTSSIHKLWNRSRSPASGEFSLQLPAY